MLNIHIYASFFFLHYFKELKLKLKKLRIIEGCLEVISFLVFPLLAVPEASRLIVTPFFFLFFFLYSFLSNGKIIILSTRVLNGAEERILSLLHFH